MTPIEHQPSRLRLLACLAAAQVLIVALVVILAPYEIYARVTRRRQSA